MKSLKKKVCVSVFLDELFEAVDEDRKGYLCNKLETIREGDTRIVRSQLISEEILFRRVTRPRKCRNALRISHGRHVYFREQFRAPEREEDRRPPVVEKVDRETSTSLRSDEDNDFDVDEYSLSDLNLDLYEEQEELKAPKVDVALSTCFAEGLPNAEGPLPKTDLQSGEQIFQRAEKSNEGTQTEAEDPEGERTRQKGRRIVEDISRDHKCFLVGRSAKSMNLAAWNHKSTQLDLATSWLPEEVDTLREDSAKGSELEEVFHYMKSRRHPVNTLKRANHVLTSKSLGMTPPLPEAGSDVIGDFLQREDKWGCGVEGDEGKVVKKGFCDVTVRTFVKTNMERIICYTLSVPWELTNSGELVIPENDFRCRHSYNDSLTLLVTRPRALSVLGPLLVGTECGHMLGRCWGYPSNVERSPVVSTSERQTLGAVIEELPHEEPLTQAEPGAKEEGEEEEKANAKPETEEQTGDEISTLEEQKVVESLASEITEQIKLFENEKQERSVADKSVVTEPPARREDEEDDVSVQWELEIEIQNEETSGIRDRARAENSNTQMIKAIEGSSRTNVILICQTPYENSLVIEDSSQHSRLSEVEQCYLKDEKIRKMYLANVPRRLLHVTEQRLKEIGRS